MDLYKILTFSGFQSIEEAPGPIRATTSFLLRKSKIETTPDAEDTATM